MNEDGIFSRDEAESSITGLELQAGSNEQQSQSVREADYQLIIEHLESARTNEGSSSN